MSLINVYKAHGDFQMKSSNPVIMSISIIIINIATLLPDSLSFMFKIFC